MAYIGIHYTHGQDIPNVAVNQLPTSITLRLDVLGGDQVSMFFENDDELINFVDKIDQALTAYLVERGRK